MYRLPTEPKLAVTKFLLTNLKQAGGWILEDQRLKNSSNAFVLCATLYSVNFNPSTKMQQIEAVYNFNTNTYLSNGSIFEWKTASPHIQNLHYNPSTDSLDVFENGLVYSIQLTRNISTWNLMKRINPFEQRQLFKRPFTVWLKFFESLEQAKCFLMPKRVCFKNRLCYRFFSRQKHTFFVTNNTHFAYGIFWVCFQNLSIAHICPRPYF